MRFLFSKVIFVGMDVPGLVCQRQAKSIEKGGEKYGKS
jgi:hypothetical protein